MTLMTTDKAAKKAAKKAKRQAARAEAIRVWKTPSLILAAESAEKKAAKKGLRPTMKVTRHRDMMMLEDQGWRVTSHFFPFAGAVPVWYMTKD